MRMTWQMLMRAATCGLVVLAAGSASAQEINLYTAREPALDGSSFSLKSTSKLPIHVLRVPPSGSRVTPVTRGGIGSVIATSMT